MRRSLRLVIISGILALTFGVGLTTASAQGGGVHVVWFGDTLSGLAVRYNTTVQAFMTYNNLPNPNYITVGQRLIIPPTGGPVTPPTSGVHVVQSGENLFRIGLRYGWDVYTLAAVNGIVNPNRIYVGQRLIIPQPRYHVVQWGENLSSIAWWYGSSVSAIMSANGLVNPNLIYPGQRLLIP